MEGKGWIRLEGAKGDEREAASWKWRVGDDRQKMAGSRWVGWGVEEGGWRWQVKGRWEVYQSGRGGVWIELERMRGCQQETAS